jgi:hypothetical protein
MNKIKTFHGGTLSIVQSEVNKFAEKNKIINASICTEKHGYDVYYTILVVYEEN